MRFYLVMALSALLHGLVAWQLVPSLLQLSVWAWALLGVLVASAVVMPLGLLLQRRRRDRQVDLWAWASMVAMGWFSSMFVLTVLRGVVNSLWWAATLIWPQLPGDAASGPATAVLVLLLATAMTLWGAVNARRTAAVVEVEVPIANLPAALHGFSIAQISDIHVGPTIKAAYLRDIVQTVNRLQVDLVAITGDLVDGSVAELAAQVAPIADLQSRHGSFFVTGNHEYYSGASAWINELRRLGLTVLLNEHVVLQQRGHAVVLAGVTDYGGGHFDAAHHSDPQAALQGAPTDAAVRVLLAHQPRSAVAAAQAGFDLQLSGHTHGGQFWPWNHFVRLQQPFTAGLHRLQALWVYTSRGTGYWGPPKRLGAASEITRIRLVPAPTV